LGVNLAGVEIILRLLDEMEETRVDMESQLADYISEAEARIVSMMENRNILVKKDESLLPVPNIKIRKSTQF
jgi:MerR family transcriptional regulator/heat shock protein HspR